MPHFTVRFELLSNNVDDYNTLKAVLIKMKFTKIIKNNDGIAYYLPQGEYRIIADLAQDQILEYAKSAVAEIGKQAKILVTKSDGTAWDGLEMV
jgi:hypothetical protein